MYRKPRSVMIKATAIAILSIVLAACAQATDLIASSPQEIQGTWHGNVRGAPGYLIISDGGTLNLARNADGSSGNTSNFSFNGSELLVTSLIEVHGCSNFLPGRYRVHLHQKNGRTVALSFETIEDTCNPRSSDLTQNTAQWVPLDAASAK